MNLKHMNILKSNSQGTKYQCLVKYKAILVVAAVMLVASNLFAQPTAEQNNAPIGFLSKSTVIPPAPEAASLGQYGNIPVSLYNGRINLSVPIYELKGKEMTLPISLSYNSGGFKVSEDPGWMGLGWTLNAGGVITRSANGRPDECTNYYDKSQQIIAAAVGLNPRQKQDFLEDISKGYIETQPDSYFYNFGSLSGKFHINSASQIVMVDYKPVTIQFSNLCVNESTITVTGPDGITYKFNDREVTDMMYDDENLTSTLDHYIYTSSWYLTEMISANAIDTFRFQYQYLPSSPTTVMPMAKSMSYTIHGPTATDGSGSTPPCGDVSGPTQVQPAVVNIARIFLSKITYRDTEINFTSTNNNSAFGGKKLDQIQTTIKGEQKRKVVFNYSYFDNSSELNDSRLRLDKVYEYGPVAQISPPYEFTYSPITLPNILSEGIDHWGYYNGSDGLIPTIQVGPCAKGAGAIRDTDPDLVKAGSLIKVKYPTGGYSEFTFEAHKKNDTYSKTTKQMVEIAHSNSAMVLGGIYQSGQSCQSFPRFNIVDLVIPDTVSRVELNAPTFVWNEQQHGEGAKVFAGIIKAEEFTFTGCNLYNYVVSNYAAFDFHWFLEQDLYPSPSFSGLIPGNYKMIVMSEFSAISPVIEVTYYTSELRDVSTLIPEQFIGGLRIKEIVDYHASGQIATRKSYEYGNAKSFGEPNYFTLSTYFSEAPKFQSNQGAPGAIDYTSQTLTISSSSNAALGTVMGSHVGYGEVIEKTLDSGGISKGYKKYYYRNNDIENAGNSFGFDLIDYGQGDLLKEEVYDENDQLLTQTLNEYAYDLSPAENRNKASIVSFLVMADPYQSNQLTLAEKETTTGSPTGAYVWFYPINEDMAYCTSWTYTNQYANCVTVVQTEDYLSNTNRKTYKVRNKSYAYTIRGNWQYLSKTIKKEFKNGAVFETYVKNYYDDSFQALPTRVDQTNSKGELIRSELTYSSRSELIKKVDLVGTDQVVNAQWVDYEFQNNKSFPKDIYFTESSVPFAKSQLSSKYVKRATYQYDFASGNLIEYNKTNDVNQSFLWSKDARYIIAEAQGTFAANIAYTSFEGSPSEGNWIFNTSVSSSAKTGIKSHSLSGKPITRNNLQSTTQYVLTYWAKDGTPSLNGVQSSDDDSSAGVDGWRFYKKIISGITLLTISGTGATLIDELRLTPVGAQMTTYAYDDRFGVTHISDTNANVTTYVYEDSGKLKMVKDNKGNILKHHVYNYQSQ